ncbi:MAG: hypothetical protein RR335_08180 [Eubacterium sp.]
MLIHTGDSLEEVRLDLHAHLERFQPGYDEIFCENDGLKKDKTVEKQEMVKKQSNAS